MTASPSTLLVTGGAGFIGSNFIRFLLQKEPCITIINLDDLTYAGNLASIRDCTECPRHRFVRGSITNADLVARLIKENRVDGIINFAAESHVDRSILGPQIFVETNIGGTLNLLTAARAGEVKRFLQVSTDEVYGSLGKTGSFSEDSQIQPNSPYSASKAGADHLVHAFHHTFGLATIITRCSNNYGPFQFPEKLIPLMILNASQDKPLPVYGDGMNIRDWLYVDDHCAAIWAAFSRGEPGQVYNIGGNNERANIEIVRLILRHLGKPESLISYVKDRPGHDQRYAIDASKAMGKLGWKPEVSFEIGIRQTIDWYLANRPWLDAVTSGEYRSFYETWYGKQA